MKIERVIRRPSGLRVKIVTRLFVDSFRNEFNYSSYVQVCGKGKRKFHAPTEGHEAATPEELHQVELELWQMIKPGGE